MSGKINVLTLGCSKNIVDSEALLRQLESNGMELTAEAGDADIAVINTCGFIEDAKQESIRTILEAVELKKRGLLKRVIVMGCLSERYSRQLQEEIPEVDAYVGANKIDAVVRTVGGDYRHELLGERLLTTPRHFAYLKISEGCDRPCSFCAIPLMRGVHASKPKERVLLEARRLAALGVKELVLIAQDSTSYGLDLYGKRTLAGLLADLGEVDGVRWIRLMYAFPTGFPVDILDQYGRNPKLCPYIDMPLQHVADPVLSSMRRGSTSDGVRRLLGDIRARVPGIAIRTTLMVGYPAEGEKEFEELLAFVNETEFDRLGVFTYSQEEGTAAFPLGDPVPAAVKEERRNRIMAAQRDISLKRNARMVGRTVEVLVDSAEDGVAFARTSSDAPEVDNEVVIHGAAAVPVGEFCTVEVVDAEEYDLFATPKGRPA